MAGAGTRPVTGATSSSVTSARPTSRSGESALPLDSWAHRAVVALLGGHHRSHCFADVLGGADAFALGVILNSTP